jgi:hypothetical protein
MQKASLLLNALAQFGPGTHYAKEVVDSAQHRPKEGSCRQEEPKAIQPDGRDRPGFQSGTSKEGA